MNTKSPSYLSFQNKITSEIVSIVPTTKYFTLPSEKKLATQYLVFKIMKKSINVIGKMGSAELKNFLIELWKRNEEVENYEVAAILNDIKNNFDLITTPSKKTSNKVKIEIK